MLDTVTAFRFDGRITSGRTMPCRLACRSDGGVEIELVAKLSAGCDLGMSALAIEALSAVLAADLGLPVPEPFLVRLELGFIDAIPDPEVAALAHRSNAMAFGSRHLPPGYTTWPAGKSIPRSAMETAAEVFAFDSLIANADRRPENPNCLFRGSNLAIYDHEAAFFMDGIIGWQPPWRAGALGNMRGDHRHLFVDQLRGRLLNLDRFAGAWSAIDANRLAAYAAALPTEWEDATPTVGRVIHYIAEVRDNIDSALQEVRRVLA